MSYFENFLKANQAYTDLRGTEHLSQKSKTHVAIVTYVDSRLHVAQASGLALGDAHILQDAGDHATGDIIRSLVISQQQLGTRETVVLHHTDCGVQSFTNGTLTVQLERDLGVDVHDKGLLPLSNVEESVCEDIAILRNFPLIPEDVVISGAVYDMDTGCMREIE